jgi:hypothetical protein
MTTAAISHFKTPETMDDLLHGHSVIIAARWMLVAVGLLIVLYRPHSITDVTVGVLGVLGIASVNFWLHTRPLTNRPTEPFLAYFASAADIAVISGLTLVYGKTPGSTYAFYYPAVVGYSLVFPSSVSALLSCAMLIFVGLTGITDGLDLGTVVARLLTLGATGFIGWRYRRVEEERLRRRAEASAVRGVYGSESVRVEAQEDVFYGQIVTIIARWSVIAGAVFTTLYRADNIASMERALIPLLVLVAANFFLQARYMMRLPANALLLQIGSAVDIVVITLLVLAGRPDFFVFYYPVALAYALVFMRRLTMIFIAVLGAGYTIVAVTVAPGLHFDGDEKGLLVRLVTLVGTSLLATMYWRIQRARRPAGYRWSQ